MQNNAVYRAETAEAAEVRLVEFETRCGKLYLAVAPAWRRAWKHIVPMFAFPSAIRKMIYTRVDSTTVFAYRNQGMHICSYGCSQP